MSDTKPTRELAARLAKTYGLSPEDTADLVSLAESQSGKPVADLQQLQADVIAAPFKPGALRGPQHAARNALATSLIALARGEALPPGSARDQILVGAGLQAPPKGDPAPNPYQVEVAHWHRDVAAFNDRKARLRKVADNPIGKREDREAAKAALMELKQPPPPKAPIPGVVD